jgi:hypothetical protein
VTELPRGALEWLVETGKMAPAPESPLSSLQPPFEGSAAERAAAGQALSAENVEAALLLFAPEAIVEAAEVGTGQRPVLVRLYLAKGRACPAAIAPGRVQVGAPLPVRELVAGLCQQMSCGPAPVDREPVTMTPDDVALVAQLWPGAGVALDTAQSAEQCVARLVGSGAPEALAPQAVASLRQRPLVQSDPAGLSVAPRYRAALAALWSGHMLEVQLARLTPEPTSQTFKQVGAKGHRFLVEQPGDALLLKWLSDAQLEQLLTAALAGPA